MFTVFEDMRNSRFRHNFKPKNSDDSAVKSAFVSEGTMEEGEIIAVKDLDIVSPTGDLLVEKLTFEVLKKNRQNIFFCLRFS